MASRGGGFRALLGCSLPIRLPHPAIHVDLFTISAGRREGPHAVTEMATCLPRAPERSFFPSKKRNVFLYLLLFDMMMMELEFFLFSPP